MTHQNGLRVLLYRDKHGFWYAQGLEADISARGDTVADAQSNFLMTLAVDARISEQKHGKVLGGIDPAPDRFFKMYDGAAGHPKPVPLDKGAFGENHVLESRLVA